jgi:hypothetical protein
MIARAIKLRDRIDRFYIDNALQMYRSRQEKAKTDEDRIYLLQNDILDIDDWRTLTETMAILKKFMLLIKRAEGNNSEGDRGVLSDYMTTMNELLNHVRKHRDDINMRTFDEDNASSTDLHLKACIVNCWTKLDDYFTILNETPAHYASVVTNPKMKWKYFEYT